MILFPNAKINLGLNIIAKRSDGYHEIETCMVPIPLFDALEMIPAKKFAFQSSGLSIPGTEKDNLVLKAMKLLKKDFNDLGEVQIHLHKRIPMGAGLGGGSSDAASALLLMNKLFDLYLEPWMLEEYAADIGSDCAFFIDNTPKIARGRGEILEAIDLDLHGSYLVLAKPPIHIGTKEAYAGVKPQQPTAVLTDTLADKSIWKDALKNDFEEPIFRKYPELAEIKRRMYAFGAYYAAMSGSGSTIFGLFNEPPVGMDWPGGYFVFSEKL